jgi:hypothetical protein
MKQPHEAQWKEPRFSTRRCPAEEQREGPSAATYSWDDSK